MPLNLSIKIHTLRLGKVKKNVLAQWSKHNKSTMCTFCGGNTAMEKYNAHICAGTSKKCVDIMQQKSP